MEEMRTSQRKKNNIIIIGVTSSLAGALIRKLKEESFRIYGFLRQLDESCIPRQNYRVALRNDVEIVEYDSDQDLLHRLNVLVRLFKSSNQGVKILYLATHLNLDVLSCFGEIPTLTIGSGAVVDWGKNLTKSIVELAQNDATREYGNYIESKAKAERLSEITIHPGFYLPNESCPFTWSGLHLKTCYEVFAPTFDPTLNWGKDKYITPMSDLVHLIAMWIKDESSSGSGGYAFGTSRAYPRWKLRELAGFMDVPGFIKFQYPETDENVYESEMQKTTSVLQKTPDEERLAEACKEAREWVKLHDSSLIMLLDP